MSWSRGSVAIKRKQKLSREDVFGAVPVKNRAASEREDEDGNLTIVLTREDSFFVKVLNKFFFIPLEKKIELDEIGSWVWRRCDDRTPVGELINMMAGEYKLSRKEAEVSLMSFLRSLSRKRLIGFALKDN